MFGLFRSRSADTRTVTCPFCLEQVMLLANTTHCPADGCRHELPPRYFERGPQMPVMFVPLLGYSNCGKTVCLNTMIWNLERLPALWPGFFVQPLTDETDGWVRAVRIRLENKTLPVSTQDADMGTPYVFGLENLRRWRNRQFHGRTLVVRDLPGERFMSGAGVPDDIMRWLLRARVLMMMFAISDLEDATRNTSQARMSDLMNRYVMAMERNGVNLKERRPTVILVLSQADQFLDATHNWPQNLVDYVRNDQILRDLESDTAGEFDDAKLSAYLRGLEAVSNDIRDHLLSRQSQRGPFRAMLAQAESRGIRLRFTMLSALGQEPDRAALTFKEKVSPFRVLDPLFTALELERG